MEEVISYSKLIRPSTSGLSHWKYFGFAADESGTVLSRSNIICVKCAKSYRYQSAEISGPHLKSHLQEVHPEIQFVTSTDTASKIDAESSDDIDSSNIEYLHEDDESMESSMGEENDDKSLADNVVAVTKDSQQFNLARDLADMCVRDLLLPGIVDGPGFRGFLSKIHPLSNIPSSGLVSSQIRKMELDYRPNSESFITAALLRHPYFAIGIDRWTNFESIIFFTISVYCHPEEHDSPFRNIYTMRDAHCSTEPLCWDDVFHWADLKSCSAAVLNFDRNDNEALDDFLKKHSIPVITCLSAVISNAASACFEIADLDELIQESQRIVSSPAVELKKPLQMISKHLWLSKLNYLEHFIEIFESNYFDNRNSQILEPIVKRFQKIVRWLSPLKMVLETISTEQNPVASLIQPLAIQLIENHFEEESNQSKRISPLKKILETEFKKHILDHDFLPCVSFLDPRFLIPTHEAFAISAKIEAMCPVDTSSQPTEPQPNVDGVKSASGPSTGLSLFFGKTAKKKTPKPFETEFASYVTRSNASLNEAPQDWWHENGHLYPLLRQAADRVLCIPVMLPNPALTLPQQIQFYENRAKIPGATVDSVMWLHALRLKQPRTVD